MWFFIAYVIGFIGVFVYDYFIGIDACDPTIHEDPRTVYPLLVIAFFNPFFIVGGLIGWIYISLNNAWTKRRLQRNERRKRIAINLQESEKELEQAFKELENEDQNKNQRDSVSNPH